MTEVVNPKRRYRSTRRSEQAADTRAAILDAARELFVVDGWQKTTIAAIAKAAGVSAETIYAVFGNKPALLEALVTAAIRGAQHETPLMDQPGPRAIAAEPNQRRQLEIFARDITQVLFRVAPIVAVARSAAESDPQLADLYHALHAGRRRNLQFVADALLANGPLRNGQNSATATSTIWRLTSPELFLLSRDVDVLTEDDYTTWLSATLTSTLLA